MPPTSTSCRVAIANELHRPGRRGPAGRRQARAVREAAGPVGRGRRGHGRRRRGGRHPVRGRVLVPPHARPSTPSASRSEAGAIGEAAALQRPLLVRLRAATRRPDQLALQGRPGHRGAGRHRQPHDRPRRVHLRPDHQCQRRGLPDLHDRAPRAASGATVGHAAGGGQRRARSRSTTRTSPPSPRPSPTAPSAPSRSPASPTGCPTASASRCSGRRGRPAFDLNRPGEFTFADQGAGAETNGYRQVLLGPQHPDLARGLPMDFPSVGYGQNDLFAWQARAFLDQVAGRRQAAAPCRRWPTACTTWRSSRRSRSPR